VRSKAANMAPMMIPASAPVLNAELSFAFEDPVGGEVVVEMGIWLPVDVMPVRVALSSAKPS